MKPEFNINSQKSIDAANQFFGAQSMALQHAIDKSNSQHMLPLMLLKDEVDEKIVYFNKEKEWNFNFVNGGWNSVRATNKEDAVKIAQDTYDSKTSTVAANTFRVATDADTKNLLSMFH